MSPQTPGYPKSELVADPFGQARRALRQMHLWLALILCVPLIVIGLTGSILVFQAELGDFLDPMPYVATGDGKPHTVTETIAAAQARIGKDYTPFRYEAPATANEPAVVGLVALAAAARGPRVIRVLVDPVSLNLVRWRHTALPRILHMVLEIHGNLLMRRTGRTCVGWLGVAMLVLGISGLVLWWPRRGRWRAAFLIKRGARGLRLHRDLHGAIGIWMFAVFIAVSFSGVYIAFPRPVGDTIEWLLPSRESSGSMPVVNEEGTRRLDPDGAIGSALAAVPGARFLSINLPLRAKRPYRISLARSGDERGAPELVALINPWSGELIELIDPARFAPAETAFDWLRIGHGGQGFGWIWQFLVFLTGLLPALFAVTGVAMWLIKRGAPRRSVRTAVPPVAG